MIETIALWIVMEVCGNVVLANPWRSADIFPQKEEALSYIANVPPAAGCTHALYLASAEKQAVFLTNLDTKTGEPKVEEPSVEEESK